MNMHLRRLSSIIVCALLTIGLTMWGYGKSAYGSELKTFKIGVIGPYTGPSAQIGREFKCAVSMAMEKIGYRIGDYKIKIVWIDEQSDAEKAARALEQAIVRDKINIGFMDWDSWVSGSCMNIAAKYKLPYFFSMGATNIVDKRYKKDPKKYIYWFGKAWPNPYKLSIAYVKAVDEAINNGIWHPKNKNVAIYGGDDNWGRTFGTAIAKQFQKAGWRVVTQQYIPTGDTQLYGLLNKIKSLDPSVLAGSMSDPPSIAAFIKESRQVGLKSLIIADGLGWAGDWYKLCGPASNYVLDQIPQWATPAAKEFVKIFEKRYHFEPGASSAGLCYDWTNYLIKVLKRTNAEYGSLSRENIMKVAKNEVMTGKLTYDSGIIMKQYKFTPQSYPDPVVSSGDFIFPVIQYHNGAGKIVWPNAWKEQNLTIPPYMKN